MTKIITANINRAANRALVNNLPIRRNQLRGNGASFVNSLQGYWAEVIFFDYRSAALMAPLLGLSFYLATMCFKSSNDLEFGMAVVNVLPSDGKVIDEGPVGCSVDVCNDDFRFLDVGLPPEILRLKEPSTPINGTSKNEFSPVTL